MFLGICCPAAELLLFQADICSIPSRFATASTSARAMFSLGFARKPRNSPTNVQNRACLLHFDGKHMANQSEDSTSLASHCDNQRKPFNYGRIRSNINWISGNGNHFMCGKWLQFPNLATRATNVTGFCPIHLKNSGCTSALQDLARQLAVACTNKQSTMGGNAGTQKNTVI